MSDAGGEATGPVRATPLTAMRQMTIANLRRGQEGKVPVTIAAEARAERLLAARQRFGGATVTVLLARLLAGTLVDHPPLNAQLVDDTLVERDGVNLGIAVALDDGSLAVPVVPQAQRRSVRDLAAALGELTARTHAGKLRLEHVRGGTFTLSSTGMIALPILGTPLLVPGQSGILLAARATERPVVHDGAIEIGRVMPLSLTFDHAVVNGMPAIGFLEDLVARIEDPDEWLA